MAVARLFSVWTLLTLLGGCVSDGKLTDPGKTSPVRAASVTIDQSELVFGAIGSTVDLTATVRDADGNVLDSAALKWEMVDGSVARVSAIGRVSPRRNGVDTVRVSVDSVSDVLQVTVNQVPVSLSFTGDPIEMSFAGENQFVRGIVVDSNGNDVPGSPVSYRSLDSTVAAVANNGTVTAVGPGTASVVAAAAGLEDSVSISVSFDGRVGGAIRGATVPCNGGLASQFPCDRIDLVSFLPLPAIGSRSGMLIGDMWGWTDTTTGRDYAMVTRIDGTAFVDVTEPTDPVYLGYLPVTAGARSSIWHDVKVYRGYAFIVSDAAGQFGMQVFDLTSLRGAGIVPQVFVETAHYSSVESSHNIVINEQSGFAYIVGANGGSSTCGSGLHSVDLRDPLNPVFAGCFADPLTGFQGTGYTHDAQCVMYAGPDPDHQGEEVCFGLNETALSIANVTDKSNTVAISRATYPGVSYAHQGWLSEDHRYLFSNDELDELDGTVARTRLLIWDVIDLDDPVVVAEHFGPNSSTDHNIYIRGDTLYQSNYQFGIRVLDISDPVNPIETGFFDTSPGEADEPGFGGSWTNYPFFDSGVILVTSESEGLYILRRQ